MLQTRSDLIPFHQTFQKDVEGGCGVIGIACAEKVAGKHLLPALCQMDNRGNGKGGGIAAAGLKPAAFGVSQEILDHDYLLAIAYLDRSCQAQLEQKYIHILFDVDHTYEMPHMDDYRQIPGLDVKPPDVVVYFVRVKPLIAATFRKTHNLLDAAESAIHDEIVYQNSYRLNRTYYASEGEKKAFVLSHGKNLLVLKMVGLGGDVIQYYQLENFFAHVWIGHHRYPTKGRVWHPGGAHPFVGMHEALVHNGDFANYFSICEYLAQRHIHPLFLTDTEVSALTFDLLHRTYGYSLEAVIEALAPTTERDFYLLPEDKQTYYKKLQQAHIHGSPDGPWFFLIAQAICKAKQSTYRLIGITDTSMLRPQVFGWQGGQVPIGLSASEKQAIDAVLESLAKEDERFWARADAYWSARGGSYTDGGAFSFTVTPQKTGQAHLECCDKFGRPVSFSSSISAHEINPKDPLAEVKHQLWQMDAVSAQAWLATQTDYRLLTALLDDLYPLIQMKQSYFKALVQQALNKVFAKGDLDSIQVYDAADFPADGPHSLARHLVDAYQQGQRQFIVYNCKGHRFIGNGFGPGTKDVTIDVYGSSGDYLASGLDGAQITVHNSAQDQVGQIMKEGRLVVYGDVGQTFFYGVKGGEAYIRGNAAGRPLINGVGRPRVIINGTCLDYLAESFMAGNPLKGGGFAIINALAWSDRGIVDLDTPYPGTNLFSLASGGALYIRDPENQLSHDQLNGGEFVPMTGEDWELIKPYLEINETLFHVGIERLLQHKGKSYSYDKAYRKIIPAHHRALQEEEAWIKM